LGLLELARLPEARLGGAGAYQGTGPSSPKNPPVGPSSPSVASRMAMAAPCSGVLSPLKSLRAVATRPGLAALTLIPVSRRALAYMIVIMFRAALDELQASNPTWETGWERSEWRVREPSGLDMFTTRAPSDLRSSGSMALVTATVPNVFTSNTWRRWSAVAEVASIV